MVARKEWCSIVALTPPALARLEFIPLTFLGQSPQEKRSDRILQELDLESMTWHRGSKRHTQGTGVAAAMCRSDPSSCMRLASPKLLEMLVADCSQLSQPLKNCLQLKSAALSRVTRPCPRHPVFNAWSVGERVNVKSYSFREHISEGHPNSRASRGSGEASGLLRTYPLFQFFLCSVLLPSLFQRCWSKSIKFLQANLHLRVYFSRLHLRQLLRQKWCQMWDLWESYFMEASLSSLNTHPG